MISNKRQKNLLVLGDKLADTLRRGNFSFWGTMLMVTFSFCQNVNAEHLSALTLEKIEKIALETAPEIAQIRYKEQALREAAVAAGELPDPTIQAGIINVPTDNFSLTQENMTQIKFSVAQAFPKGQSLSIKSQQKELMAKAEQFRGQNTKASILLTVRTEWLEIYYWTQAAKIVDEMMGTFKHLVDVTESMLAVGKTRQHDVLRAQLELSNIENRHIQIEQQIATLRARLGRWIGQEIAGLALPDRLPVWPQPPAQHLLQQKINQHPHIKSDASLVAASRQEVAHAEEQYKPGWNLGLHYGFRQGTNTGRTSRRADFVGAQVGFDLPIFTAQRQDRHLAQSLANLHATRELQESDYRKMTSEVGQQYALWQKLLRQAEHYQQRLLPEAKQYAEATLPAYQNLLSDFSTLVQAFIAQLDTQLKELRIRVDLSKTRAALLYLEGSD
ncbi:MAG: TolC family protein [Pseudomonadota bacterium]